MDRIVFGDNTINKPVSDINLLSKNNKSRPAHAPESNVSAHILMTGPSRVPAPVPAPAPAPAPVAINGTSQITELLAKNAKLKNDINVITNKYNTLVTQLRAAGIIH
jgi:hypothetical protein